MKLTGQESDALKMYLEFGKRHGTCQVEEIDSVGNAVIVSCGDHRTTLEFGFQVGQWGILKIKHETSRGVSSYRVSRYSDGEFFFIPMGGNPAGEQMVRE